VKNYFLFVRRPNLARRRRKRCVRARIHSFDETLGARAATARATSTHRARGAREVARRLDARDGYYFYVRSRGARAEVDARGVRETHGRRARVG
tara:strand:+ start:3253 stop:3534 length:282 start_codon:yes stop_codon:yes gene_type:complete